MIRYRSIFRCTRSLSKYAAALAAAAAVAACGGGGGGGSSSASPTGPSATASSAGSGSALTVRVNGSKLVDGSGKTVQLRGVNVSGLESVAVLGWSPSNPWGGQTGTPTPDWNLIKTWGVNAVRLPLNEASWLGYSCVDTGGVAGTAGAVLNPDPGANYKATVAKSVADATAAGLYVILDLHWSAPANNCPMAQNSMADTANSIPFWTQIATQFKSYPNVVFELYNEPFLYWLSGGAQPWSGLDNGGTETEFATGGNPAQASLNWQAAGMQQMLSAVRATGASNVVLVAGVAWAQDLSQWLANKPSDPLNQMAAVWHAYPAYQATFGTAAYVQPDFAPGIWSDVQNIVAAGYPVVITEFGDQNSSGTPNAPFASNLLPWADQHGVSYMAWTWDLWQQGNDVLIKDASGTPTDGFGVYVKAHYLCRAAGTASCS